MEAPTTQSMLVGPVLTASGFALLLLPLGLHAFGEPMFFMKVDIPILVISFVLSVIGLLFGPIVVLKQRLNPDPTVGLSKKGLWILSVGSSFGLSLLTLSLGLYVLFWGMAYRML